MYTQYFNITPAVCGPPTVCAAGTCVYFENTMVGMFFLGYGHHVTVTILASDVLPTRLGAYSNTSGEFAINFNPPHVGDVVTHDFALTDTYIEFELQPNTGFDFNIRVDYDLAPGETSADGFCAYGTRVQSGVQNALIITEGLVAAAAILAPEFAWAEVALGTLIGLTFPAGNVCSGPPPSIPTFSAADFILGTDIPLPSTLPKLMTLFEALMWGNFCECVPASGGFPRLCRFLSLLTALRRHSPRRPQPLSRVIRAIYAALSMQLCGCFARCPPSWPRWSQKQPSSNARAYLLAMCLEQRTAP